MLLIRLLACNLDHTIFYAMMSLFDSQPNFPGNWLIGSQRSPKNWHKNVSELTQKCSQLPLNAEKWGAKLEGISDASNSMASNDFSVWLFI